MTQNEEERYGIAAVARQTGLTTANIRIWEKRYGAVVPERTESNRRLYRADDVERLTLLEALTKKGHSIRNLAKLGLVQLRDRLRAVSEANPEGRPDAGREPVNPRLLLVGGGLENALKEISQGSLLTCFENMETALAAPCLPESDLLVIELETVLPDQVIEVNELAQRTKTGKAILLYRFASSRTLADLSAVFSRMVFLRAPVSENQLRRECLLQLNASALPDPDARPDTGSMPEPLYTLDQLTKLERMSSTVECECPQHLAELLQGLYAFEKYSSECKDLNSDDALLHAFLHRTTARARRTMEEALQHVIKAEGIDLP